MIDFSNAPYFDDFDPNKHFHRILFKPGKAVQARELTQSQSILQDQISKFASHIFTQNTPIQGGNVSIDKNVYYLKLNQTFNGVDVDVNNFLNRIIRNSSGTILARVLAVEEATIVNNVILDAPTIIVSYISGIRFTDSSEIFTADDSNFSAQMVATNSTGKSSIAHISDGVFYVVNGYSFSEIPNPDGTFTKYSIGNFVNVQSQSIILNKYDNSPSLRIGLNITETIYDFVDDVSLLDPAIGASNYQAPGADRYVILLTLETRPLSLGSDDGFIELVRMENGEIKKQVDSTVYSTIDDYFAKRTFDTNGDYIVEPFKFTPNISSNTEEFLINVGKGIAYVRGYRVENQSGFNISNSRSRSNNSINNQLITIDYGNYIYTNNIKGVFDITTSPVFELHCVNKQFISSSNANSHNSTLIGTAKVRNIMFDSFSDVSTNTSSYIYKTFITDIDSRSLSSNISSVISANTLRVYDPFSKFSSSNGAYNGVNITISNGEVGKIISYDGSTKTIILSKNLLLSPSTTDTLSLSFQIKDLESIGIFNGSFIPTSSASIDKRSKFGTIDSGDVILQEPSYPELLFNVGFSYVKSISDSSYQSKKIFRGYQFIQNGGNAELEITLDSNLAPVLNFVGRTVSPLSASEILENFVVIVKNAGGNAGLFVGDILDFTSGSRSITIAADSNSVKFVASDLSAVGSLIVDVIAKVNVNNADNNAQVLKTKTLITSPNTVNLATGFTSPVSNVFVNLTAAQVYIRNNALVQKGKPQSLFISDVKRIIKIVDSLNPSTNVTTAMISNPSNDISSNYTFNNGQTDHLYDHAFLSLKPGARQPQGNILVLLEYYSHSGGDGYFSVMSYPVNDYRNIPGYISKNGTPYKLRDCLDFRLSRTNASNTVSYRTTAGSDSGSYIPENLSEFTCDYSYYLARKDLLVLTKDKNFEIINGIPSIKPTYPQQPDGSLLLSKISLDPFTAFIPGEAPTGTLPNLSMETVQHKRWRMEDISELNQRVNNIEYYTTLNLLEQKTQGLKVPDENGIDRFKNGILVDDFSSYLTADTTNPDFSASINFRTTEMTARQLVKNFPLQSSAVLNSWGKLSSPNSYKVHTINKNTNIFTLPYTTSNVVSQPLASNTVNINPFNVPQYHGVLEINPPMDNWVDDEKAPDLVIVDPSIQVFQQTDTVNVLNVGDWKVIPGTQQVSSTSSSTTEFFLNHQINNDIGFGLGFDGTNWIGVGSATTSTTTTTSTYADLTRTSTLGSYKKLNNTYSLNNSYLTDISILPYIRQQELLIKAKGLSINTPVTVTFDGVDVTDLVYDPDVIELSNVSGEFEEGDIVGFYQSNIFYPVATVVGVHNKTSTVRLYVAANFQSSFNDQFTSLQIQNAIFDSDGNYVGSTASGSLTSNGIVTTNKNGLITAVGPYVIDENLNNISYFRVYPGGQFGAFHRNFGIWGTPNSKGAPYSLAPSIWRFRAPADGTYYIRWASSPEQYGYVKIDSTTVLGGGTSPNFNKIANPSNPTHFVSGDFTINLSAGDHLIEMYVYNDGSLVNDNGDAVFALGISQNVWESWGLYNNQYNIPGGTLGDIIFATSSIVANSVPLQSGTATTMPKGGIYYTGVSQFSLFGMANTSPDFYVGCNVTINSTRTSFSGSNLTKSTITNKTKVISYNASSFLVTVDPPVDLSYGINSTFGDLNSKYSITGTHTNYAQAAIEGGLAKSSTDESGQYIGVFHIPKNTFKTGERVLRIDNRTTPLDPGSATTFAEGTFTASGLSTKSQALNFGASISGASSTFKRSSERSNQLITTNSSIATIVNPWDPLAQTFIVSKENYPNGVFISSISLFFKTKPSNGIKTPVTVKIVGTQNGYPDGKVLDHAIKTLSPDKVLVSNNPHILDSSTKTTFYFDAPVYIQPGQLYAFIVQSDSSDYNIFMAAQDAFALPSTVKNNPSDSTPDILTKIGTAPYVGNLFESQNSMTWTATQGKALMMVIDRCVFNTSTSSNIPFVVGKKLPYRKTSMDDLRYYIDQNSTSHGNNFADKDQISDAYNITTTDFTPTGTKISYFYKSTLNSNKSMTDFAPVIPGKFACPTPDDIYLNDGKGERILISNSNSSFVLNCSLSTSSDAVSPIIADDGLSLFNIEYVVNNLELSNNQVVFSSFGSGYSSNLSNTTISISAPDVSGGTQAFANAIVSGGQVVGIEFTNPGSGYLNPPTISINGANTTSAIAGMINEFSPHGGNASCKYFTKKVVLAPGNESEDLRVFFNAYRPKGSEIYIFYKLLNSNDPSRFDDNNWQLMTLVGENRNVFSINRTNIYEYEAAPGINGEPKGFITYISQNGQEYKSFSQFALKVVITTSDKTQVPFLADIRALALPAFSGV